jgi:hypothetical protein
MLASLNNELASRQAKFRIVEAHASVRDLLRAEGLEEQVGYLGRHISIDQAITESVVAAEERPIPSDGAQAPHK